MAAAALLGGLRASDIEPYTGLRYLSKLFRFMAVVLVLVLGRGGSQPAACTLGRGVNPDPPRRSEPPHRARRRALGARAISPTS